MGNKGLHANIYTSADYRGIRERTAPGMNHSVVHAFADVNNVTMTGLDFPEIFEPDAKHPEAILIERIIGGQRVYHVEPLIRPDGCGRPMFGGAFIHSSDSRFSAVTGIYGAIPLHDRFER